MKAVSFINKLSSKYFGLKIYKSKDSFTKLGIRRVVKWQKKSTLKDLNNFDLTEFLDKTKDIFYSSLGNPEFLTTSKKPNPITISVNRLVKSIRLEQDNKDNFHLHSIELFDINGKPISLTQTAVVSVSNKVNRYDKMTTSERSKKLFSPHGHHLYAFYTRNEGNSWIEVSLPNEVYVSKMKIRNTEKGMDPRAHTAHKALGMKVCVADSSSKSHCIYTLTGLKIFSIRYVKLAKSMNMNRYSNAKYLYDFISAVVKMQDKKTCVKLFNKIPESYKDKVTKSLNDRILYDRNMEWTKHGVRKSFRFWSTDEKKDYIEFSLKVIEDLKKISPDVSFSSGSVLAAIRDKDLIPHDDDIDIMIALEPSQATTLTEAKALVEKHMKKMKYKVSGEYFAHKKIMDDRFQLDLFVGIYEDGKIGWYPHKRNAFDKKDIFPVKYIPVLGIDCPVPKNTLRYIEECYGKNWKTPDPNWTISWDESPYIDIS